MRLCPGLDGPLYEYRFGHRPKDGKRIDSGEEVKKIGTDVGGNGKKRRGFMIEEWRKAVWLQAELERIERQLEDGWAQAQGHGVQYGRIPRGKGGTRRGPVERLGVRLAEMETEAQRLRERLERIQADINAIPDDRDRVILKYYCLDGVGVRGIARRLRMAAGTVERALGRYRGTAENGGKRKKSG